MPILDICGGDSGHHHKCPDFRLHSSELFDNIVNSAFLLQGRADEFTTKTPAQRKQVLANILGLEVWEIYEKRARERMTDVFSVTIS